MQPNFDDVRARVERPIFPSVPELDQSLLDAIDNYCIELRRRMVARALKGEATYHGKWKGISIQDLDQEIQEELDDVHVYRAMQGAKRGTRIIPPVVPEGSLYGTRAGLD